jgi:hypothetical protein
MPGGAHVAVEDRALAELVVVGSVQEFLESVNIVSTVANLQQPLGAHKHFWL